MRLSEVKTNIFLVISVVHTGWALGQVEVEFFFFDHGNKE